MAASPSGLRTFHRSFDYLVDNARSYPNAIAWVERALDGTSHSLSWNQIHRLTLSMAERLSYWGVRQGDRLAWWSYNSLEWVLVELACQGLGGVTVPLDPRLDDRTAHGIQESIEPRLTLLAPEFRTRLDGTLIPSWQSLSSGLDFESRVCRELKWLESSSEEIATILHTSGTTGVARGVMLTHRNLVANGLAKLRAMPQFPSDHRLNILPFAHAYGRTCELTAWLISASSMEVARGMEDLFARFLSSRPSLFNGVPLVYERLGDIWNEQGGEPESIRHQLGGRVRQLACGGAPIGPALRKRFHEAKLPIYQGYGLTETSPVVCSNVHPDSGAEICLEGVGPAVDGVELKIEADGRLLVRGSGVMAGYWRDPEATRSRLRNLGDGCETSWFDTGDMAREIGERGAIEILGRADDTIVLRNGYKFQPKDVEERISRLPGVLDCIALPSKEGGWCVVAKRIDDRRSVMPDDLSNVRQAASPEIRGELVSVVWCDDEWSVDNGLLNFKGAKRRSEFRRKYLG